MLTRFQKWFGSSGEDHIRLELSLQAGRADVGTKGPRKSATCERCTHARVVRMNPSSAPGCVAESIHRQLWLTLRACRSNDHDANHARGGIDCPTPHTCTPHVGSARHFTHGHLPLIAYNFTSVREVWHPLTTCGAHSCALSRHTRLHPHERHRIRSPSRLLIRANVDAPPRELRREPRVLAFLTDRERELPLGYDRTRLTIHLIGYHNRVH